MKLKRHLVFLIVAAALAGAPLRAQSLPEVVEAIDRARVTTRILYVTAHPDDESSSVLTYLARGLGADVALLSITRGEGGQNALGPEQGPQLGILRAEELLAATRAYGVRLYFTRAPDFGYSKTPEETLKVWGDTALGDLVRVIRTFRPRVVINNWGGVRAGHGHHQAAGILTPQAVAAAADPKAFPEQLADGLQPWRASLLLQLSRGEDAGGYRLPLDQISPILGKSYREIGLEGFVHHRTQGIAGFLNSPFLRRPISLTAPDGAKLDPAQLAEPLEAFAARYPAQRDVLGPALERAHRSLVQARESALELDWSQSARALAAAGHEVNALLSDLNVRRSKDVAGEYAELDMVRERIDEALTKVCGLRLEARADRSEFVAGESFTLRVEVRHRSEVPIRVDEPDVQLPDRLGGIPSEKEATGTYKFIVPVPPEMASLSIPSQWMYPFPPPLFGAAVVGHVENYTFIAEAPATALRVSSTRVDALPLRLVPAVTLTLEPRQFVTIEKQPPKQLDLLARVHYYASAASKVTVGLDVPESWRASPPQEIEFSGAGDHLVRFRVTPPARVAVGKYALAAWASRDAEKFRTSLEPLPSLPTQLWSEPAGATVHAFEVAVPEGLRVGYVAAENDPIPEALRQLGVHVELLDPVALAFGDLGRFDGIAIGIRAYELRQDLARSNQRLLDYAAAGGTLVVQYQREYVWTALKPAPYSASIGQPAVRITDENAPVRFLVPAHPVLNFPNKITQDDFQGWQQERGLYFWSQWDPRYQPVLALRDPGEEEATGGLVYARVGKGVYIYTGLAFFRQLPEGAPGAYRLFVNLLSQSRARAETP